MNVLYLLAVFIFLVVIRPMVQLKMSQHRAFAPKINTQGEKVRVCDEYHIENTQTITSFGDPLIRILLYADGSIDLRGNKKDIQKLRQVVYAYHVLNVRYQTDYQSPMCTTRYSRVEPWETWPTAGKRFLKAVRLALQDPACHKPSDWICEAPQQHGRIAS